MRPRQLKKPEVENSRTLLLNTVTCRSKIRRQQLCAPAQCDGPPAELGDRSIERRPCNAQMPRELEMIFKQVW